MSIHLQHVNPVGTRAYMGTLTDGIALHDALRTIAQKRDIQCATFELLGGLTEVTFTAYDFLQQKRRDPITLNGAFEIISGHGTISQHQNQPHIHTHLTLAYYDTDGKLALVAGHAAHARVFAVEFTLIAYDGAPPQRQLHPDTGLQLWHLPPLE